MRSPPSRPSSSPAASALNWLEDRKDADGYYTTSAERFSTNTYALATENLDIDDGLPGSATDYGKVRFKVRSDDATPVFVGIARTRDVDAYLDRSAHATLTDFDVDPFEADYRTTGGLDRARPRPARRRSGPPRPPAPARRR